MKRLISLIIAVICIGLYAQSQLVYRPLNHFNGNKAEYLKYNFDERGSVYQGKTLGVLLADVEITAVGYERFMAESTVDNRTYIYGITLYFSKYSINDFSQLKDQYLTIWWETPFLIDDVRAMEKLYPAEHWVTQHYNYFKDKKIALVKYKVM